MKDIAMLQRKTHTRIATAYNDGFLSTPAFTALMTAGVRNHSFKVLYSREGGNIRFAPAQKH